MLVQLPEQSVISTSNAFSLRMANAAVLLLDLHGVTDGAHIETESQRLSVLKPCGSSSNWGRVEGLSQRLRMEIHVESPNADMLPKSCYVSVRVGEVLKQGRYEPKRAYNFPAIDRRRDVRVDVYQHVGSCLLAAEPDSTSVHDVFATSTHPDFPAMKFKVSVSTRSEEVQKSKVDRATKMKGKAKEYLGSHRIEEKLSEAVKALLKEQPAEPLDFICKYLQGSKKEKSLAPVVSARASSQPVERPQAAAEGGEESFVSVDGTGDPRNDMQSVRSEMCQLLVEAAENGKLEGVLKESGGAAAHSAEDLKKAEGARKKAGNMLVTAVDNGDFEKILKELQENKSGKKNEQKLRHKAANLLINAAENGDLQKALKEIQPSDDRQDTRKKVAAMLIETAGNGKLEAALREIGSLRSRTPDLEALQRSVGNTLMLAMENGDLAKALQPSVPNGP
ncbi:unnamed protein product [Effrenium voratum]|nr:unnamed protein product [Effrenium voratum]